MAEIQNDEVQEAITYCAEIMAHRHPKSKHGIPQALAVDLMVLKRFLTKQTETFKDGYLDLLAAHGTMKVEGVRESAEVSKDSPNRGAFNVAVMHLNRTKIDVPNHMCVPREKFKIRDEEDQLVDIEIGAVGGLVGLLPHIG